MAQVGFAHPGHFLQKRAWKVAGIIVRSFFVVAHFSAHDKDLFKASNIAIDRQIHT